MRAKLAFLSKAQTSKKEKGLQVCILYRQNMRTNIYQLLRAKNSPFSLSVRACDSTCCTISHIAKRLTYNPLIFTVESECFEEIEITTAAPMDDVSKLEL